MSISGRQLSSDQLARWIDEKNVGSLESALAQLAATGGIYKPVVVALMEIDTDDSWDAIGRFLAQRQTAAASFTVADLEEVVDPGVARALGAGLSNPNPHFRRAIARALARQETGPSVPHLVRATRDPDSEVARIARTTIAQRVERDPRSLSEVPERSLDGVFDILDERYPYRLIGGEFAESVRVVAARRIGASSHPEAAEALVGLALEAEGRLGEVCWEALERRPSLPDRLLQPLLASPRPSTRARALRLFAPSAGEEDARVFEEASRAEELEVREAALAGLARVAGTSAIPILSAALDDSERIRRLAIDLLGDLEEATPQLLAVIEHEDPEIRKRAMIHLANRGVIDDSLMPSYFELLERGRTCSDPNDAQFIDSLTTVAKFLGEHQVPEGLRPLAQLARGILRPLRRAAIEAIMKYEPSIRADVLHELADTRDLDVLRNVAMGLHEAGDGRLAIPMIRVSRECRGAVVRRAKAHLEEIEELEDADIVASLLSQPYASVRRFAAESLTEIQDPLAIPALLVASRDEDVDVQLAVFEALSPFASEHELVRQRMLEAVGYGDVSVRQAACEALGEARCREAVPDLIKALQNAFLRRRATAALRRIGDRVGMLAIKRIERRERMFPKRPSARRASGRG